MRIKRQWLVTAVSISVLSTGFLACSSGSGQSPAPQQPGDIAPAISPAANGLQGTWNMPCTPDRQSRTSLAGTLTFSGESVSSELDIYNDPNCEVRQQTQVYNGTYRLGPPARREDRLPSIDYQITDLQITYYDPQAVDQANREMAHSGCQAPSEWQVGVTQDLSNQPGCMKEDWIGQRRYSVIKVDGDKLYMGDGTNRGDQPGSRSTQVSGIFLTRQ